MYESHTCTIRRSACPVLIHSNWIWLAAMQFGNYDLAKAEDRADWAALPDTHFQRQLDAIDACESARLWVGGRTLEEAWSECRVATWMAWLLEQIEHPFAFDDATAYDMRAFVSLSEVTELLEVTVRERDARD